MFGAVVAGEPDAVSEQGDNLAAMAPPAVIPLCVNAMEVRLPLGGQDERQEIGLTDLEGRHHVCTSRTALIGQTV